MVQYLLILYEQTVKQNAIIFGFISSFFEMCEEYNMAEIWNSIVIVFSWMMHHLVIVNVFLSVIIIFFERRDPRNVWTWLLVLYFIPILGFLCYFIIGADFHKSKMFRTKEIEDRISNVIRLQETKIVNKEFAELPHGYEKYQDLLMYNLESEGAVYTDENDVEIYFDGIKKFNALAAELDKATEYIHIQYYIIKPDEVFEKIEKVLARKAKEGVEVRILYDSMGCRYMKRKDWKRLHDEGIQTAEFFPAKLKKLHLRINYRNHRKIVVIDGKVGFVGGFNVGREYIGKDEYFKYWRDTHLKIEGAAVMALNSRFVLDWNYATKQNLFTEKYFPVNEKPYKSVSKTGLQIISDGPDEKILNIRNNYLWLINNAKDHIYIQSPYFIPDDAIFTALQIAAMSGIDVRIMIPCKPDHPFVYWASYSYMSDLLEAGARFYTYQPGFLHVKGVMADGKICSFGTANMDIRSFQLNFEVNAVIYHEHTTKKMEEQFCKDMEVSKEITLYDYARRSIIIRIKEQVSRLLSPLL